MIPAFDEEARLAPTLDRVHAWLAARFSSFEVLVVDDGSTDGTASLVEERVPRLPGLRLLREKHNRGKGHAVRRGLLQASGDALLFSDADLSTPIEEAERGLALLAAGFDVAIASRALPDSDVRGRQHAVRGGMGKTFNLLVGLLTGLPFRDTQCGFKLFTRAAARAIFSRATVDGFAFDVEALVIARRLGLRVTDYPVRWVHSPPSRVRLVIDSTVMAVELARIAWRERRAGEGRAG